MCLAVPGKILEIDGDDPFLRTGRVSFGGVIKTVSLACVPEARVNDYVLVHVGMALSVVDEQEAAETFAYLEQMAGIAGLGARSQPAPPPFAAAPAAGVDTRPAPPPHIP